MGADIKEFEGEVYPSSSTSNETNNVFKLSDQFHFVRADISDPDQAKLIVDEAVQKFGNKIHVLINNAGLLYASDVYLSSNTNNYCIITIFGIYP